MKRIAIPAAAALLALAVILGIRSARAPGTGSPVEDLLRRAPSSARRYEARINGARWTPVHIVGRAQRRATAEELEFEGYAGEILRRSEHTQSPELLHAAGVASLLLGRAAEAADQLQGAAQRAPEDVSIWSDVAAARLAMATTRNDPQRLPTALAAADRALRLSPLSSAAHFNRALILTRLGLHHVARGAWRNTLQHEREREWAAEARQNLQALTNAPPAPLESELGQAAGDAAWNAVVQRRIEEVRAKGETIFVTEWAEAFARGDAAEAERLLSRLRRIGDAVLAASGDAFLRDVVRTLDGATSRAELARAHLAYRDARLRLRDQLTNADAELRSVASQFESLGSPMAYAARYYAANGAFDRNRVEEARTLLEGVLAEIDPRRYPTLAAGVQKQLGLYYGFRGMWSAALLHLQRAHDQFASCGEQINAAFTDAIVGEVYDRIGQTGRGWRHRTSALRVLSRNAPDQRSLSVLVGAVHTEILRGEYESALSLVNIAREEARQVGDAVLTAELMVRQTRVLLIARGTEPAASTVEEAKRAAAAIADPLARRRVAADIAVAEGEIVMRTDPGRAVVILTPAIEFYEAHGFGMLLPPAYLERGRAYLASGNREAALEDFRRGLAEIERQRENVAIDVRTTIFDTIPDLIAETVQLLLEDGKDAEAYGVVERARARTLIEALGVPRSDSGEPGIDAIAATLPEHAAVIEYALLPRGVAAFCIRRGGMTVVRLQVGRESLRRDVEALGVAIDARGPIPEVQTLAAALFAHVVSPVEAQIADATLLYIVPDRFLYAMPFPALFDRVRGEYLIQRRRIVIAPSGAFLLRRPKIVPELEPALIISDPANDRDSKRLPAAWREASAVARLYPEAVFLNGAEATVERFVTAATRSRLIHYAGHAGAEDDADGFLSLAASRATDGRLDATAISRLRLQSASLVVLSACATMRGSVSRVEGMPSVARAFLTAGAPAVLGMLWEIDDQSAAPLLLLFHQLLREHRSASGALQAAQCELLRSENATLRHPASWAAAALLGVD